ncbi:hypothetical protein B4U79_18170 [Dinothrombium tinctorium]|uniref:F-box domain-containing protein n=1 Tax=Dinothrombium tinctorium TaxID=1965070 RepID=A0A3S3PUC4_9ACAR|nr:hypothetical protein B4U79_18170 [Dinothrombium tinctorium]
MDIKAMNAWVRKKKSQQISKSNTCENCETSRTLIDRLKRENEDFRRENVCLKSRLISIECEKHLFVENREENSIVVICDQFSQAYLRHQMKAMLSGIDNILWFAPKEYGKMAEKSFREQMLAFDYIDDILWFNPTVYAQIAEECWSLAEMRNAIISTPNSKFAKPEESEGCEMFLKLTFDILSSIFLLLDNDDLLSLRMVSKRFKEISDFELQRRQKELRLYHTRSYLKLNFFSEFYFHIRSLYIKNIRIAFYPFLLILKNKLNLNYFGIEDQQDVNDHNIQFIAECFPNLTSLTMVSIDAKEGIFLLIKNLEKLTHLKFIRMWKFFSRCSFFMFQTLESLQITGCNLKRKYLAALLENEQFLQLNKLAIEVFKKDAQFMWQKIGEKMLNLTELKFYTEGTITNIAFIRCAFLRSLTIRVHSFAAFSSFSTLKSVEELNLHIFQDEDQLIAKIVSCFPSLKIFKIFINKANQNYSQTLQIVSSLSLQSMLIIRSFHDNSKFGKAKEMDFLEVSKTCVEFTLHLYEINLTEFKEFINKFRSIAKQRNQCKMSILLHCSEWDESSVNSEEAERMEACNCPKNMNLIFEEARSCKLNDLT